MKPSKSLLSISTLSLSLLLAACGGGGGDDDDNPNDPGNGGNIDLTKGCTGQEINDIEAVDISEGTYLTASLFTTELSHGTYSVEGAGLGIFERRDSELGFIDCDTNEWEAFDDDDDFDDSDSCSEKFFRESDGSICVSEVCEDEGESFILKLSKINDNTDFDAGSASFTADNIPDLDATSGVCGTIGSTTSEIEEEKSENTFIRIVAPYDDGGRMAISISITGSNIEPGTYTINGNENNVSIETEVFTSADPAVSGTVTIESVTDTSARGTFNIVTVDGVTVSDGIFNIKLN